MTVRERQARQGAAASRQAPAVALLLLASAAAVAAVHAINAALHGAYVVRPAEEATLRVLSWNIGKVYLGRESRADDRDLGHVARVIREANPRVVALQELRDRTQLGRLLARLGPAWIGRLPDDAYDRRAALLLRLDAAFVDLGTSSGRVAQGALARALGERRLLLASVHLDAFDPRRRLRQAEEILAGARRLGPTAMVLAGDFNIDPALPEARPADRQLYRLLTRELTDAAAVAGRPGGTTVVASRLDYVFFAWPRVRAARARVLRDRRINLMDHDPLLVDLVLAPP